LELYGRAVRWFHDAACPDDADPAAWRPLAQRVFSTAGAGPVHLNMSFREPLVGTPGELPEPIGPPLPVPRGISVSGLIGEPFDRQRGVIVAGGCHGVNPAAIEALAARLGWPILADPLSGVRRSEFGIAHFDAILRHPAFAADHAPEVVVRFGRPPASKVLTQWIVGSGAPVLQVGGPGVVNPDHNVARFCCIDDLAGLAGASSTPWMARWRNADQRAEAAIATWLAGHPLCEPGVAHAIAGWLPTDAELVVASSMPVRDLEWFGGRAARAHANRGANGIDGVLSTALGRALSGPTTVAWLGDIAFVHDSNAMVALGSRQVDLRIVVTDNGGGGIFSFLPQASLLTGDRFEQLFGTPHGADLVALAAAHGVPGRTVTTVEALLASLATPGPSLTRVVTDRTENVAVHAALNTSVAEALG
jgi:2-succinyl-5-enolpyruvyl-6-hydroxy-3-cyclohexene-1-carboxylate synthase